MNKGLAHILLTRISNLPFIDLYAGIVTVQEKKDVEVDDLGKVIKTVTTRFPVSCDVIDYGNCAEAKGLVDLMPDGKRKGILYFEDNGIKYNGSSGVYSNYTSFIRLVCWINTLFIEKSSCHAMALPLMNEVIKKICANPFFNQEGFLKVLVNVAGIPKSGRELFSSYTYDDSITQYLMPPYESFGIDFQIRFSIHNNCISDIKIKEGKDC